MCRVFACHVGGPGFHLRYHKISKERKAKVSLPFAPSDASPLNCISWLCLVNTPSTSCLGGHPVCTWVLLFNQGGFKVLQGYPVLRESVLHLSNYLPRFLIINFFNLFTLNQLHIIILLFPGKLPTFPLLSQIFQKCVSPSGLANVHPEEFPTLHSPSPTFPPFAAFSYGVAPVPVGYDFIYSVHLVSFPSLLTCHTRRIIEEQSRLNFSTLKRQQYSNLGSVIFMRLCN